MKVSKLLILIVITCIACKSKDKYHKAAEEIAANLPSTKNMNVGKEKYTVSIPNGWRTEHKTAYGIDYYFLFAPKTVEDPNTNINVITESMQNLSIDEYEVKTIEGLKKAIPDVVVVSEGEIAAGDLKGRWYSYTMKPQGLDATIVSYIFPKNGIAYIISGGTQTKDASRYRSTFDSVARSLRFEEQ